MHPPSGSRRNSSYICGTHRHGCFCGQTAKIRQNWPDKQFASWLTAEESLSTQISDRVPRLRKSARFQPSHRLKAEPAGSVLNNAGDRVKDAAPARAAAHQRIGVSSWLMNRFGISNSTQAQFQVAARVSLPFLS